MRLLITTQALDLDDPVLSTYHAWVVGLSEKFESVEVICLKEGRHELPENVTVHSLGKENRKQETGNKIAYVTRFLALAWKLRAKYDAVFVHMNEEYLLIAGWLWRLLGKRVYLWRNHYAGSWRTDLAAFWCTTVFCTSAHSYTAKYRKTKIMPVGVNTERFGASKEPRIPRSILFFSRIAPSKRPEMFVDALALLNEQGIAFSASIVGSPLPEYEAYYRMLQAKAKAHGIGDMVAFSPGVPNDKAPMLFARHEYYVNCSPSGLYDKVLFEAAASGCIVLTSSDDFREATSNAFWFHDAASLAERISAFFSTPATNEERAILARVVEEHRFTHLMEKLSGAILVR